jgi:hypothetical protein
MRKRLFIALILILMLIPMSIAQANKPLRFDTYYKLSAIAPPPDPVTCDEGLGLAWVGDVKGPFTGNIYYCMHAPTDPDHNRLTGITNHWSGAYWEIWVDGEPVLRGEEAGSTTFLPLGAQKFANWRAMGVVTSPPGVEPEQPYKDLIGRPFHDGGDVYGIPPALEGNGTLIIH